MKGLATLLLFTAGLLLTGCAAPKTIAKTDQAKLLQGAEEYVSTLRAQNQLPGFKSDEHGRLVAMAPWHSGAVSYPVSVSVRAWKEGDQATYCYALAKHDQNTPWRLVSATRLDKQGKVLEEFNSK